jgi:hypothetical protein
MVGNTFISFDLSRQFMWAMDTGSITDCAGC